MTTIAYRKGVLAADTGTYPSRMGETFKIAQFALASVPKYPLEIRGCGYGCPAVYDATGKMFAMGSQELCEQVKAWWDRNRDIFDASGISADVGVR